MNRKVLIFLMVIFLSSILIGCTIKKHNAKQPVYTFALTESVVGNDILSFKWGTEKCQNEFGEEWFWVDNNYNVPFINMSFSGAYYSKGWISNGFCRNSSIKTLDESNDFLYDLSYLYRNEYPEYDAEKDFKYYTLIHNTGYFSIVEKNNDDTVSVIFQPSYLIRYYPANQSISCKESLPLICAKFNDIAMSEKKLKELKMTLLRWEIEENNTLELKRIIDKAVQNKNIAICNEFDKSLYSQARCMRDVIVSLPNPGPALCNNVSRFAAPYIYKDCIVQVAKITKNVSTCDMLSDDLGTSHVCRREFFKVIPDKNVCFNIPKEKDCLYDYASVTGDDSVCALAELTESESLVCYRKVAVVTQNQDICNKFTGESKIICNCGIKNNVTYMATRVSDISAVCKE